MLFYIELENGNIIIDTIKGVILTSENITFHSEINKILTFKEDINKELTVKYSDSEYQKVKSVKIKNKSLIFFNKAKDLNRLKGLCKKIV